MPEFILDHGTPDTARAFKALDGFTQGYIEAMFFTDCEHGTFRPDPNESAADIGRLWDPEKHSCLPGDVTVADIAPETLARIIADCAAFQQANADLLAEASELVPGSEGLRYGRNVLDGRRLGQLFWYARNGHGISFTDDGNASCLQSLQDACGWQTSFGTVDSYLGDDDLIHL